MLAYMIDWRIRHLQKMREKFKKSSSWEYLSIFRLIWCHAFQIFFTRREGQDWGVDRNNSLSHTTKRMKTTNLKTKNNQNCQKKHCMEVQQPRSWRNIQPDGRGGRDRQLGWRGHSKATASQLHKQAHIWVQTSLGKSGGARRTAKPRVSAWETKDSKPQFVVKICEDCGHGRNSQPHSRVHWRDPQGPKMYTNPPTYKSAPKGHKLLVESKVTESEPRAKQASSIVPSLTPPPHTAPQHSKEGCPALENT